jgi:hypothetical protein
VDVLWNDSNATNGKNTRNSKNTGNCLIYACIIIINIHSYDLQHNDITLIYCSGERALGVVVVLSLTNDNLSKASIKRHQIESNN